MKTGVALEIVWQIAKGTLATTGASARDQEALDIVEDLIVNEYGEDDEALESPPLWERDDIQFPRLLAEIQGVGLTRTQYEALSDSMDLIPGEIDDLLERADSAWQRHKAEWFKRKDSEDDRK